MATYETRAGGPLPPSREPDLASLFERAKLDGKRFAKAEMEFAKAEGKARFDVAKKPAAMLGAAGVLAWFGLFALTLALGYLLAGLLGLPLAFFVVAIIYFVAGAVLGKKGIDEIKAATKMQADRANSGKADWVEAR